jgi:pyruvate,water dikinase
MQRDFGNPSVSLGRPGFPDTGTEMHQSQEPLILALPAVSDAQCRLAGGKAGPLARMLREGLPVPPGFCLTTTAFNQFLASSPRHTELHAMLAQDWSGRVSEIATFSRAVTDWLTALPVPTAVQTQALKAWREQGEDRAYAVRSSATAEDAAEHSFAGQFESFLNVRGETALLEAIKSCWLSLFSERAMAYQARHGRSPVGASMAVVVQAMVPAEQAGVMFTADPVTGDTNRIVIEGVPGLGDQLVSGHVAAEHVVVEKETLQVLDRGTPDKPRVLDDRLAERLGQLAQQVERLFGQPQDIEWAVADGQVFLLQARPITVTRPTAAPASPLPTWRRPAGPPSQDSASWEERQVWSNINAGEVLPDVMTPATWSLIQLFIAELAQPLFRVLGADQSRAPGVGRIAGRIYFNANTGFAAAKPFAKLLWNIPNATKALGGARIPLREDGRPDIADEDLPDLGFRWYKYPLSWPRTLVELVTHSPRRGDAWTQRLKARENPLAELDLNTLASPELARRFDHVLREGFKGWDILYLVEQAAALPWFQWTCHNWLNDPDLSLGYRLFTALGGIPETEAGLALWRLAARARADAGLEATLSGSDRWSEMQAKLAATEPGRRFLAAWEAFMAEHGHHCRGELELFNARWSEQPDYILGVVRGYLRSIGQTDPLENHRRLARERERLTAQCLQRLRNPVKRWVFSRSLRRSQKLAINREEWKNQAVRHIAALRRILLALGERLASDGVLTRPDDVFFLEVTEVEPVAAGRAHFDVLTTINRRREEYDRNLTRNPPPVVVGRFDPNGARSSTGVPPVPGEPSASSESESSRRGRRDACPTLSSTHEDSPENAVQAALAVLTGIPVFPGVVIGPARVILRADDHEQVLPGEILIAPFTDPAWTPYFLPAAGVVMDLGGILSHGSIVAREYGLPAVTNVGSATQTIRTGDRVQVDGGAGRVVILERARANP